MRNQDVAHVPSSLRLLLLQMPIPFLSITPHDGLCVPTLALKSLTMIHLSVLGTATFID